MRGLLKNKDKFYGLADSIGLSGFRLLSGLVIAHLGNPELFADYIILVTSSLIIQLIPTTRYLIPMQNLGTGKGEGSYTLLSKWALNKLNRFSLIAAFAGGLLLLIPSLPFSQTAGYSCLIATLAQIQLLYFRTRLQTEFSQHHALLGDIIACTIHIIATYLFFITGMELLPAFWLGAFVGALCGCIAMKCHIKKLSIDQSPYPESDLIERSTNQGKSIFHGSMANSACSRFQPYLLEALTNPLTVASYGVIWTLIGPIRLLSMAFTNLLRPRLALHHNQSDQKKFFFLFRTAIMLLTISGLIASVSSIYLAELAIDILFGSEYTQAAYLLSIALVYATLDAVTTTQMIALQVRKENGAKITARLRIHAAVISLLLFVPLTNLFGLTGTISSLILAETYYLVRSIIESGIRQDTSGAITN